MIRMIKKAKKKRKKKKTNNNNNKARQQETNVATQTGGDEQPQGAAADASHIHEARAEIEQQLDGLSRRLEEGLGGATGEPASRAAPSGPTREQLLRAGCEAFIQSVRNAAAPPLKEQAPVVADAMQATVFSACDTLRAALRGAGIVVQDNG